MSAGNGDVRFRTEDYSIDVKLHLRIHIEKILKVKEFRKGVVTADILYRREDETDEDLRTVEEYFDIGYNLRILGISKKLIKQVKKVKAEREAVEINGFLFRGYNKSGDRYIEVVNASDNRKRSIYFAETCELVVSSMPDDMHSKYSEGLKTYCKLIKKDLEAFGYKAI